MKIVGIIPARYASTRFPAKALADINGKSMVQRVHEQSCKAKLLDNVVIATDNKEIYDHCRSFGAEVCMTSESHNSGTDRCMEALSLLKPAYDYVINIQGDEPFVQPDQIDLVAAALDGSVQLATLIKKIDNSSLLENKNVVKVIKNKLGQAIYFSRTPIPYLRNLPSSDWPLHFDYFKHIGMYAYRADVLKEVAQLAPSRLEQAESLEQLRWIENGYSINVVETDIETIGIDTPEDLERALSSKPSDR
ncbi:MAG: 3-deoxy-manno-octulosonate cytidylyltransferase [Cyclobacteriaceae bacterium]